MGFKKKFAVLAMAAVMAALPVTGVFASLRVTPASETTQSESGGTTTSVAAMDPEAAVSFTIYKYDVTAARAAGLSTTNYTATGEQDATAEADLKNYAIAGVGFTYLKVGDIVEDSDNAGIHYTLASGLVSALSLDDEKTNYSATEINTALTEYLSGSSNRRDVLEKYVTDNNGTAMALTDDAGKTATGELKTLSDNKNTAQGLYLVVETKVPQNVHTTTEPFFLSLPMTNKAGNGWNYNVYVYPKNQTGEPTLDKQVAEAPATTTITPDYADTATVSKGDTVDYRIVSKLPKITSTATYLTQYTYVDTMTKGIEYNRDSVSIAFYDSETAAKNDGTKKTDGNWDKVKANGHFTVEVDTANNKMTIAMTQSGLTEINTKMSEAYMVISYTATVKSTDNMVLGDTGNPNEVVLTWKRTNTDKYDTLKDKTEVFTYGIQLTKVFSDESSDFSNVTFNLKNNTDNVYIVASETAENSGIYQVTGTTDTESSATLFKPQKTQTGSNGVLYIKGLEPDSYLLTEKSTAARFSLLKDAIPIVITGTGATITSDTDGSLVTTINSTASATVDGKSATMVADSGNANALVPVRVANTKSFTLPQTGGLGSLIFTLAGAAVVVIGIAVITKGKKKDRA